MTMRLGVKKRLQVTNVIGVFVVSAQGFEPWTY